VRAAPLAQVERAREVMLIEFDPAIRRRRHRIRR